MEKKKKIRAKKKTRGRTGEKKKQLRPGNTYYRLRKNLNYHNVRKKKKRTSREKGGSNATPACRGGGNGVRREEGAVGATKRGRGNKKKAMR